MLRLLNIYSTKLNLDWRSFLFGRPNGIWRRTTEQGMTETTLSELGITLDRSEWKNIDNAEMNEEDKVRVNYFLQFTIVYSIYTAYTDRSDE